VSAQTARTCTFYCTSFCTYCHFTRCIHLHFHAKLRSEGGTSIEDLAEKFPEKIIKIPVDIRVGITDEQAQQMAKGLAVTGDISAAADQIKRLYQLFASSDCTMVEVSLKGYVNTVNEAQK
jgi:hypothetical protein